MSAAAKAALEAIWVCMVELAEEGNDLVVASQLAADPESAKRIASRAADMNALAGAAIVLARRSDGDGA